MFHRNSNSWRLASGSLLFAALVGGFVVLPAGAQTAAPAKKAVAAPVRYTPNRFSKRAQVYYETIWGVDSLSVKWAESGEMIRFSWRVLDPEKAQSLSDEKLEPSLIDTQAGLSLVVPQLPFAGKLRQMAKPEAGRSYWVAFSNKGRMVKHGDRVNVVIGQFRAEGLVVD